MEPARRNTGVDVPPPPLLHAEKASDAITTATEINVREFIPSSNTNPSSEVEIPDTRRFRNNFIRKKRKRAGRSLSLIYLYRPPNRPSVSWIAPRSRRVVPWL